MTPVYTLTNGVLRKDGIACFLPTGLGTVSLGIAMQQYADREALWKEARRCS